MLHSFLQASGVMAIVSLIAAVSLAQAPTSGEVANDKEAGPVARDPGASPSAVRPGPPQSLSNLPGTRGDVILEGDATFPVTGVLLRSKTAWPDIAAQIGTETGSYFNIVTPSGASRFWVTGYGYATFQKSASIVMDTSSTNPEIRMQAGDINGYYPVLRFHTETGAIIGQVFGYKQSGLWLDAAPNHHVVVRTGVNEALRVVENGSIGVGTSWVRAQLHVQSATMPPLRIEATQGYPVEFRDPQATEGYSSGILMNMIGNSLIKVSNMQIGYVGIPLIQSTGSAGTLPLYLNRYNNNDVVIGQSVFASRLRVEGSGVSTFAGSVTVAGNMTVSGNIAAKYQDLAEWVPSVERIQPGTVVILDPHRSNHVAPSAGAYDTAVAGVVSAQPGIALGEPGDSRTLVATTGRVRVRVDASSNPIAIGDLLVTAGKSGVAMKSIPVEIQGIRLHRPGTVLGKALEPLQSGEGEILILLTLQ